MSDIAVSARPGPIPRIRNRVLFTLSGIALFAVASGGFLSNAANRLADGRSLALWQGPPADAAGICGLLVALIAASFLDEKRRVLIVVAAAAATALLATLLAAGDFSEQLSRNAPLAARRSLGPAFWILVATAALAIIDTLQRLRASPLWSMAVAIAVAAVIAAIVLGGALDSLSLAQEFAAHRDLFYAAVVRHAELVSAALVCAILCGVPLTIALLRHEQARAPVFVTLNLLQTLPSIALFGVLIEPLSFLARQVPALQSLGIGGIGAAPAIIALVLYSLLPLVRNATTGLAEIDPAVIESAQGMGMTEPEIFRRVRLPLALPALVSALRIVTIQAIGLAAIAALIGAGGLGDFVFQGIGQYALDLVLLGALPIVLLALVADLVFQIWLAALRRSP